MKGISDEKALANVQGSERLTVSAISTTLDTGEMEHPTASPSAPMCGGGGTGRRKGLKIPRPARAVRVRFPPSAPQSRIDPSKM